jgi:hypothetical protein
MLRTGSAQGEPEGVARTSTSTRASLRTAASVATERWASTQSVVACGLALRATPVAPTIAADDAR